MKQKKRHQCHSNKFGLIRYRTWYGTFCSRQCKNLYIIRLEAEIRKRKEWLLALARPGP